MIKRLIPLSKQISFAIQNSSKILQIQKVQFPNQMKSYKLYYNFCKNQKISLKEGIEQIKQLENHQVPLNDLGAIFSIQLQVVKYLEENLQNFEDLFFKGLYIEQMLSINWAQVAIYAYQKQENPLNNELTSKLMNLELMKELDIIKENNTKEPKEIESLRIRLKAASIMCYMINYGVKAEINQLHEWMNDYLDLIELDKSNSPQFQLLNDQIINFYFFIAQIHRQRNLTEEFQRFLDQGIEEAKSYADRVLLQNKGTLRMELILINFFELYSNLRTEDANQEIILEYAKKVVEFASKFWKNSIQSFIQDIKVSFAVYFMSCELYENAAALLKEIYKFRSTVDSDNSQFLLYSNIYFCQKQGLLKDIDINQVIIEVDKLDWIDLDFLLIQVLDFYMCIFEEALVSQDQQKIELRFQKIIHYIHELSNLIKKKQIKATLPIFNWIDTVLVNDLVKNNVQYILSIYHALNQFKDINLEIDRQDLEKDFYLIILSFQLDKQLKLDINQKVKGVEKFVKKYLSNQGLQILAIEKVLLFNFQLIEQGKLDECIKIIDSLIPILSKELHFNKHVQQLQNQKNLAQRTKQHK